MSDTLERFVREIRHAARRLIHDWRFSAAAVLILGLGIGANAAIFSVVNAALLRTQGIADVDRLVDLYQTGSNPNGVDGNSYPAYLDVAARTDVFESAAAALVPLPVSYLEGGALTSALVEHVTPTYPQVLGIQPALGRWFDASEDRPGAAVVGVVSHAAWQRRFRGDASVIGRTLQMNGVPVTIVGVGPAGHRATIDIGLLTDFWLPVHAVRGFGAPPRVLERKPEESAFSVKARLRDGVSVEQAQAAMRILGARLAAEYPTEDPGKGIQVVASRDVRIHPQMDGLLTAVASVLQAIVALVLAIASSNLATLLLVRGSARAREVSVRLALGASRGQLVRLLLAESLLLSLAGCAAGCVLAWWAIRGLGALELPIVLDLALDYRVLGFAAAISVVTGVAFGLAPALKATRVDLVSILRGDGETRASGFRRLALKDVLVALQVALSVLLLGGTGVFLQILQASRAAEPGFAVDGIAMLETDGRFAGLSPAEARQTFDALRRRVEALPGVEAVVAARGMPMQTEGRPVFVEGADPGPARDGATGAAVAVWAGPGFFEALRIPLRAGRAIDERDGPHAPPVAVISESMARQILRLDDPALALGRRFRLDREPDPRGWLTVIGIARDTGTADRQGDIVDPQPRMFYRSFAQAGEAPDVLIARTSREAAAVLPELQRELRAVNPALPVVQATTMAQYLEASLAAPKAMASFVGGLGALGLGLAAIGLYAIVAFAVARRSREIGIRMALGAPRGRVVRSVAGGVAALVGVGTVAGVGLTLLAIAALRSVTIDTPGITVYRPSADPLALAIVAGFVACVAVAAAFVPARRAARLDPLLALRRD